MKKALFLFFVIVSIANESNGQKQGQEKIDALLSVLKTAKTDTAKVTSLNRLANEFMNYNPDTAIYFAGEALMLSTKLNYVMGIANAHLTIGYGLFNLGKYTEALKNCNDAIKLYDELLTSATIANKSKILKKKGKTFNVIGNINDSQGKYVEALKNYFAALKLNEELGNKSGKSDNLTNIGVIYMQQGNYTEALKNYFAALKLDEELGDKSGKISDLNNIGTIYGIQVKYTEALKYLLEASKLSEGLVNKKDFAGNLHNIGNVYYCQGNFNEALKYHFAALKILEEIGEKESRTSCFNNIGNDYIKLKKYGEASRYLNKGLTLAKEIGSLQSIKYSYWSLSALDSSQGNLSRSLENYKMYFIYHDSMVNDENAKKTVQIQMQYEFDKKESLAKAEQEKKDALTLKELQKQKLLRNGIMGGFLVLLIFAVIISIIMIQFREIRLIKKERTRISRELHDDIGAELNRITVISQLLQKKTNEDAEMQGKLIKISEAGKKVLGSIGEIIWTMNPQKDNLESLVAYIRRFVTEYLEMNGIEVDIEFPDEIPSKSVSDEYRRNIFLVIKEAIYNITKYSKATIVRFTMHLEKGRAGFEIHDNGIGFSVKEKQNWGNGLKNMNQRMKDIKGDFRISSEKNLGTLIKLTFPVH